MRNRLICCCDTETLDGLNGSLFACGVIRYMHNDKYFVTEDKDEFSKFILSKPQTKFYFHNLNFDIRFLLDYCQRHKIIIPAPIIRGSNYISQEFLSLEDKKRLVHIYDSYALIPTSLDNFTSIFSLKDNEGKDLKKIEVDFKNPNKEELLKHCERDTEILSKGLKAFFLLFPLAKYCDTLPQCSMKEFSLSEKRYQFTSKQIGRKTIIDSALEETARFGYHGGRNEVYNFNYFGKVYYYDINSLYPFVMKSNLYPISYCHNPHKSVLKEELYYVKAKVSMPYYFIPNLPIKQDKLMFGYGTFTDWFYSPEFNAIKDYCDSIEILDGYEFEGDYLFYNFVKKYWDLRQKYKKEKNHLEKLVKLYLNSLYGKFGQRRENKSYSYIWELQEGLDEINDGVYIKENMSFSKSRKINPFISGFVTSYARNELQEYLNNIQEDSVYCDTDSVVTTKQLKNVGEDLGQFKLEGEGQFKAICCKTYFFLNDLEIKHKFDEDRRKAKKYFSHKAKGVYDCNIPLSDNYEDFMKEIRNTHIEIFAKPRESIRRYGNFVQVKEMSKLLSFDYDKRKINKDLTTSPVMW